jgi:hypothetical protein
MKTEISGPNHALCKPPILRRLREGFEKRFALSPADDQN